MRGAPKPTSTAELRVANECTPLTEMRGSAPTEECLAQWATPAPPAEDPQEKEMKGVNMLLDESFAAPLALAAMVALYA
jgi:hypothetical protein